MGWNDLEVLGVVVAFAVLFGYCALRAWLFWVIYNCMSGITFYVGCLGRLGCVLYVLGC